MATSAVSERVPPRATDEPPAIPERVRLIELVPHVVPPVALKAVTKLFEEQALAPPYPETDPEELVTRRADLVPEMVRLVVEAIEVERVVVVALVVVERSMNAPPVTSNAVLLVAVAVAPMTRAVAEFG